MKNSLIHALASKDTNQVIGIVKEIKKKGLDVYFKAISENEANKIKRNTLNFMKQSLADMGFGKEEIEKVGDDLDIEMAIGQIENLRLKN